MNPVKREDIPKVRDEQIKAIEQKILDLALEWARLSVMGAYWNHADGNFDLICHTSRESRANCTMDNLKTKAETLLLWSTLQDRDRP